jgi:uncharacterized membrane protein
MDSDIKPYVFPHDRVVLFSDAVFAIAMTLLAIELKVPPRARADAEGLGTALVELTPVLIGYFVSFAVIGLFWAGHMRTWKHVTAATTGIVWLNILQLMFVALMPFTTGLYTEYFGSNLAFSLYCLNLAGIAVFAYWVRSVVIRREHLVQKIGAHEVAWLRSQTLIALFVFLGCIPLAWVAPWSARYGFIMILVLQVIMKRYLNRRERLRVAAQSG